MCGFIGFTHHNKENRDNIIKKMTDVIIHRGPDEVGYYSDDAVAYGFRRLSILDLSSSGNQPFINESKQIILVFNGEIYNHKVLRADLESKGFVFKSDTDSEVVLHGYEYYGMNILHKLRGMFAFSIWDKTSETLYIARDHFGIKPVYYTQHTTDQSLIFGSEIKAFIEHPDFIKTFNKDALKPYLMFQYSAMDESFFKGVYKLKPAHYLKYKNNTIEEIKYYHIPLKNQHTSDDYPEMIHDVMKDSVEVHKQSDVKVGAFLSGGVDSSYIVALLKPDKTFSVGFKAYEEMFDETNLAKELSDSLGIEHHKKIINADEFFRSIPTIQYHMDEPHANLSAVPLYFLSELASKHVTVVLSGEGADELFAGYEWYRKSNYLRLYETLPFSMRSNISNSIKSLPANRITNFIRKSAIPVEQSFIGQAKIFSEVDVDELLNKPYRKGPCCLSVTEPVFNEVKGKDDLTQMQYLDMHKWLPGDILQKADKMSMAHSIELRVPYLDKEVMKVAARIPPGKRILNQVTKYPLRQASAKLLPESWSNREKVGFPVPIKYWLKEEKYHNLVKEVITGSTAEQFFDVTVLKRYLEDHLIGQANHARYLWTVYVFMIWYKQYF